MGRGELRIFNIGSKTHVNFNRYQQFEERFEIDVHSPCPEIVNVLAKSVESVVSLI